MKKIITLSLLASSSFIATNHAAALEDTALTARAAGRATRATPSTLEQLETFLRRNYDTDFPEIGFGAFCAPFKPEFSRLKRIDQMRTQNAAIDTLGQMATLGYCSFTQELDSLKTPTPHFADRAASRPEEKAHYHRFTHSHFLRFQIMVMHLLELAQAKTGDLAKDARAALTQPYGSSDTLKIAWLQDSTGIVSAPFDGKLKQTIYSSSMPYGDWGDDLQRSMVFVDGKLIEAPGIDVHTNDGVTFKFIRENGLRGGFITSPLTMRTSSKHPIVLALLGSGVFRTRSTPTSLSAFLTLPATPIEDKEFEAAFLGELMEVVARGEPAPFEEAFIAGYLQASEYVEQPETEDSSGAAAAGATPLGTIATHIDLLYEEQILAEQAAISRRVVEDLRKAAAPAVSKKGGASKKGKAQTATVAITASTEAPTETFSEEKAALRREILSKLKERGRTKWRTLARVLITALKSAHDNKTRG